MCSSDMKRAPYSSSSSMGASSGSRFAVLCPPQPATGHQHGVTHHIRACTHSGTLSPPCIAPPTHPRSRQRERRPVFQPRSPAPPPPPHNREWGLTDGRPAFFIYLALSLLLCPYFPFIITCFDLRNIFEGCECTRN